MWLWLNEDEGDGLIYWASKFKASCQAKMSRNLLEFNWSQPLAKSFRRKSFFLNRQSLSITGENQLRLVSAPTTGLLNNGFIHGPGSLALNVAVSLVRQGGGFPGFPSVGSGVENHGVIAAESLTIRATIRGIYSDWTYGVANYGVINNAKAIYAEDNVDRVGLFNAGIISGFNDLGYKSNIIGKSFGLNQFGTGILNLGTINTGGLLQGSGVSGIKNYGLIDFEASAEGMNRTLGDGFSTGIYNAGTLRGSRFSEILRGNGGFSFYGAPTHGIVNEGQIKLAAGNDRIVARGSGRGSFLPKPPFGFSPDLINAGVIDMGDGNDRIDVSENGIAGSLGKVGSIEMGAGRDIFFGFGDDQIISGGAGVDTLRLPAGSYEFTPSGFPASGAMEVSAVGASLLFTGFERVGLIGAVGTIPFPVNGGTLTFG